MDATTQQNENIDLGADTWDQCNPERPIGYWMPETILYDLSAQARRVSVRVQTAAQRFGHCTSSAVQGGTANRCPQYLSPPRRLLLLIDRHAKFQILLDAPPHDALIKIHQ